MLWGLERIEGLPPLECSLNRTISLEVAVPQ